MSVLGGLFSSYMVVGADREDALRLLAVGLAESRLSALLRRARWHVLEIADDERFYVVAADRAGGLWAIAVNQGQGDDQRRGVEGFMIEDQADRHGRSVRPVVLQPADARDATSLTQAIELHNRTAPPDSG
jgi:hypothetical protein